MDVAAFAELLRETAARHDGYEKTHAQHHWSDWYAPYLIARQNGDSSAEAAAAAERYMEQVHHVRPLDAATSSRPDAVETIPSSAQ